MDDCEFDFMDDQGRTRRSKRLYLKRKKSTPVVIVPDESIPDTPDDDEQSDNIDNEHSEPTDIEQLVKLVEDGDYDKIDKRLLKRLKTKQTIPEIDPLTQQINKLAETFSDTPEYVHLLVEGKPLNDDFIKRASEKFNKNHWAKKMGEMTGNLPLEYMALQRSAISHQNFEYRYKPPVQPRVTNQYHSGRCWMFASLNVLRYEFIYKLNLDPKFEFSAAYLFFWDKIERCQMGLEGTWALRESPLDDRYLSEVFTNPGSHVIQDGGYWQYFQNLVSKYGLVPKSIYNDSYNCLCSNEMNEVLVSFLNQKCLEMKRNFQDDDWSREDFDSFKDQIMVTIYGLVSRFMGEPPKTFDWRYKDAQEQYQEVKNLTPEKFYRVLVPHSAESKMTFVHDPRHPEYYFKPYHVEYANNVVGGGSTIFINVPIETMKYGISESLINNEPVWFGCDVGACLDGETGIMDTERFDYKRVLGIDIIHSKADMLQMKTSVASHAMVINGVDMDEPEDDNIDRFYRKWRVENSWGYFNLESHPDNGYWQMSDKWFDQYVFMAVIDLKYFPQTVLEQIMENKDDVLVIKPWDAFGTVAMMSGCNHCQTHDIKK